MKLLFFILVLVIAGCGGMDINNDVTFVNDEPTNTNDPTHYSCNNEYLWDSLPQGVNVIDEKLISEVGAAIDFMSPLGSIFYVTDEPAPVKVICASDENKELLHNGSGVCYVMVSDWANCFLESAEILIKCDLPNIPTYKEIIAHELYHALGFWEHRAILVCADYDCPEIIDEFNERYGN